MMLEYRGYMPQFQVPVVEGASGLTILGVNVEPARRVVYEIPDGTSEGDIAALDIYMSDLGYVRVIPT